MIRINPTLGVVKTRPIVPKNDTLFYVDMIAKIVNKVAKNAFKTISEASR